MVKTVNAFNVKEVEDALKECLAFNGPSVLITSGACFQIHKKIERVFEVDADKCIACQKCFKAGCPAIVISEDVNPKTGKHKSRIDPTLCAGCSICSQICPVKAIKVKEA